MSQSAAKPPPPSKPPAPCPICGAPRVEKFRPFCSRRCADIDLNRWLSGVYAIPVTADDDEDGDEPGGDRGGGLGGDSGGER